MNNKELEMDTYWKEQERFNNEYWKQGENKDDHYWDVSLFHEEIEYWNDETKGLKHDHVLAKDEAACEAHHEEKDGHDESKDTKEEHIENVSKSKEERYEEYKREKEIRLAAQANNQALDQNAGLAMYHAAKEQKPKMPKGLLNYPPILFFASLFLMLNSAVDYADENVGGSLITIVLTLFVIIKAGKMKKFGLKWVCILTIAICCVSLLFIIMFFSDLLMSGPVG